MAQLILLAVSLVPSAVCLGQIRGQVSAKDGTPLRGVSVYLLDPTWGTSTDDRGFFELDSTSTKRSLHFQAAGYKLKKITIDSKSTAKLIEVQLTEERFALSQWTKIDPEDPAFAVIRAASQHRKRNNPALRNYSIDFYSKGYIQLETDQQKFLGQKREDLDPELQADSLQHNVFYFSELLSTLYMDSRGRSKEEVIASKYSGSDKGFSFTTGLASNFNLYQSDVNYSVKLISPLAPIAPSYYNFRLENSFRDAQGHLIHKIEVQPKRNKEPLMQGYIYIVDQSWEIYSVDAFVQGANVNLPKIDQLHLIQNYRLDPVLKSWIKTDQCLEFFGKILVFDYSSSYNYTYSNYQKIEDLHRSKFGSNWIRFDAKAEKHGDAYWNEKRPIPLTQEEKNEFLFEGNILESKSTKSYMDSLDQKSNRFTLFKLVKGYEYKNSFDNAKFVYRGLLSSFAFNPVQGFNVTTGVSYIQDWEDDRRSEAGIVLNYGIGENRPRFSGYAAHTFNKFNYNTVELTGGITVEQFGSEDAPIKNLINSIGGSWFGKNFAKFYQKSAVRLGYQQYALSYTQWNASLEYAERKPLFNNLTRSPFVKDPLFGSNHPLDPTDFATAPFQSNQIFKFNLGVALVFDQKLIHYPKHRSYIPNSKYPILSIQYEKGFSSSTADYNYGFLSASTFYNSAIGNWGDLSLGIDTGKFFGGRGMAFMDYKHFNANQTFIGSASVYNQHFNLLPYYSFSTNDSYIQYHMEHDFKGFVLNKIPLLNQLRYSLVIGAHQLNVQDKQTYHEFSIGLNNFGFGKFRPFRIDYFRSYQGGFKDQGLILGVKILDLIQK